LITGLLTAAEVRMGQCELVSTTAARGEWLGRVWGVRTTCTRRYTRCTHNRQL